MSESLCSKPDLSPPKEAERHFTIKHYDHCDVISNLSYCGGIDLDLLAAQLAAYPVSMWPRDIFRQAPNVAAFNFFGHGLVFKSKAVFTEAERRLFRGSAFGAPPFHFDSVMKEISLAPRIEHVVQSRAVQSLAQAAGYSRIKFLPPIAAIIESNGTKTVAYDFVLGVPLSNLDAHAKQLTASLNAAFFESGIIAHDLHPGHLLHCAGGLLCLTDTEGYIGRGYASQHGTS